MDEQILNQSNYSREEYWKFFLELILAEYSQDENPHSTEEILRANKDKLNQTFLEYFPDFCKELINSDSENKDLSVALIENLSIRISNFSLGNIAINKEIVIAGYNIVLANRIGNTEKYAQTQNNLAIAYSDRVKGSRADNLEWAIACYQSALTVYTPDAFPQDWATIQNNLAVAYLYRIKESKPDNLEQAITCYENALAVRTKDTFPEDWAQTQNNLGLAYSNRIKGAKADNLERVIACYQSALTVYTPDAFRQDWATTQNNLAIAYSDRIKGSRADNLERAIACYESALTVRTKDALPQYWAMTQNNLAVAYCKRIKGSRADNIEQAIACCESALTVRTKDALPEQWATTQNNLATAYCDRIKGSRAHNLERAIACYEFALTVRTKDAFPQYWAMTQNNLAAAYYDRIKESKADNLERAIACYEFALTVLTKDAFPQQWAQTQNNLAITYRDRVNGQPAENINKAVELLRAALQERTPDKLPQDCLQSARNLGDLGFERERWDIAKEGYQLGIEAVEKMCEWSPTKFHQAIRKDGLDVYEKMILACLNSDDLATALLTVERSKSRSVVQMLTNAEVQPKHATPEQLERLQILRRQYLSFFPVSNDDDQDNTDTPPDQTTDQSTDRETRQVEISQPSQSPNEQQQRELEQQLNQLLEEINDPEFSLTQKIQPIELSEIQDFLNENTVILDWYILNDYQGWLTFIITKNDIQVEKNYDAEQYEALQQWQIEYFKDYHYARKNKQWSEQLTNRIEQLSKILGINEILQTIPAQYQQLILIPHQFLHIFPLHALPAQRRDKTTGNLQTGCLMELFPQGVHYMPNCRILERLHQREKNIDQTATGRLFAIQNPDNNLPYANVEVQTISQQIQNQFHIDPTILINTEANKTRLFSPEILAILKQTKYLHFACHGKFNQKNPLYSALKLAKELEQTSNAITNQTPDEITDQIPDPTIPAKEDRLLTLRDGGTFDPLIEGLTMQEIVAKLDLPQALLVILSACETGLIKWETIDEYIGLPTGFLLAGALRVISSNWPVDDFVTAFLMVRAYYNYLSGEYTISQSLQQAQIWLKNVSSEKFIQWLRDDLKYSETNWKRCRLRIKRMNNQGDRPFDHPKYWASFQHIGLI
jgi:CHAT domain-containing protein